MDARADGTPLIPIETSDDFGQYKKSPNKRSQEGPKLQQMINM